jgi:hypothetical protein
MQCKSRSVSTSENDVSDAARLAQLGAHSLVRGSFVPPEPIRQLRDLKRPAPRSPAKAPTKFNCWKSS